MSSPEAEPNGEAANATPRPSDLIKDYLLQRSSVFRELDQLRQRGWENQGGDKYFQEQRQRADNPTVGIKEEFFHRMCAVGAEMDAKTSALTIPERLDLDGSRPSKPAILDLGMAPGGFSHAALERNPTATLKGISLPTSMGGYDMMMPDWKTDPRVDVSFQDLTMLAAEMGMPRDEIPAEYASASSFVHVRPFEGHEFDLVICGGQVVRAYVQDVSRKGPELIRLLASQMVLALNRIREGGTLVVVLHRPEIWDTFARIYACASFADITLFKPTTAHRIRSSFYLVARNVQPHCDAAQKAVEEWKAQWRTTTFSVAPTNSDGDGDVESLARLHATDETVAAMLEDFGPQLIRLSLPVFTIQATALRHAPFMRKKRQSRRPR